MPDDLVTAYQRVLDLAVAILDHPRPDLPIDLIATEMTACLPSTIAFYFDLRDDSARISGMTGQDPSAFHTMLAVCGEHPLYHQYRDTGMAAVLDAKTVVGDHAWRHSDIYAVSRTLLGVTQHVTVPIQVSARGLRGFSIGRDGSGYTEDELDLARRVQAVIASTDRHLRAYRHWHESIDSTDKVALAEDCNLTPREIIVLTQLAQARTAHVIARRLGISYRTVNKHVQNLYRKLGTSDRLTTIQRAHALGLLSGN